MKAAPVRIFLGQFNTSGNRYAAMSGSSSDLQFADFLTGIEQAAGAAMHTRLPVGSSGSVSNFDEYIDFKLAVSETTEADPLTVFKRFDKVEEFSMWQDDNFPYRYRPTNTITLETEGTEALRPTRRLSLPYPNPSINEPLVGWLPTNYATHSNFDTYGRFYVTLLDVTDAVESYPATVDIAYHNGAGLSHVIRVFNRNAFTCHYSFFYAPITKDVRQTWQLKDWPFGVVGKIHVASIPANSYVDVTVLIDGGTLNSTLVTLPALNDARARIAFDYYASHRIDSTTGRFQQEWLVLFTNNHKYYKGIVVATSQNIKHGFDRSGDKSIQIVLQRTEEGLFTDSAITNPNTADYFRVEWPT